MASESVESNMDREMILADFQVCLFFIWPLCEPCQLAGLFVVVFLPLTTYTT